MFGGRDIFMFVIDNRWVSVKICGKADEVLLFRCMLKEMNRLSNRDMY